MRAEVVLDVQTRVLELPAYWYRLLDSHIQGESALEIYWNWLVSK